MSFTCVDCGPEALPPVAAVAFVVTALGVGLAATWSLHQLRGASTAGGRIAMRRMLAWMGYLGAALLFLFALRGRIPFW